MRHLKAEGERIPLGWAVAYRDFDRDVGVCYPIPVHFVVRWMRDVRCWLMTVGRPGFREKIEQRERRRATTWVAERIEQERRSIHAEGHAEGYAAGWQAAFDKLDADLRRKPTDDA